MTNIQKLFIVAMLSCVVGCSGSAKSNRSLNSIHQPVVKRAVYTFDVATAQGGLSPAEQGRLDGWFEAMQLSHGDQVALEDPSPYSKDAVRAIIKSMVERRGLLLGETAPVTEGVIAREHVRVTLSRSSASVTGCPDWSGQSLINISNATSPNYGCATNSNLAAMIADPNDLIRGVDEIGNDPGSTSKSISAFRERELSGGGGEVSEVSSSSDGGGQ